MIIKASTFKNYNFNKESWRLKTLFYVLFIWLIPILMCHRHIRSDFIQKCMLARLCSVCTCNYDTLNKEIFYDSKLQLLYLVCIRFSHQIALPCILICRFILQSIPVPAQITTPLCLYFQVFAFFPFQNKLLVIIL